MDLSNNLTKQVLEHLHLDPGTPITIDMLGHIKRLDLKKEDIEYLKHFFNIEEVSFSSFPSISDEDILELSKYKIKKMSIIEQSALFNLDFNGFKFLKELEIIHNENITFIGGLKEIEKLTLFDNKSFTDIESIFDSVKNTKLELDIVYYKKILNFSMLNYIGSDIIDNIYWIGSVGLRKYIVHDYSNYEIEFIINSIVKVTSKYIYAKDDEYERFAVLYKWMIDNIEFINDDIEEPRNSINSIYDVFRYKVASRLLYARTFQLLLSFADIDAAMVYSLGALKDFQFASGETAVSLLGSSDYGLLRVKLSNKYYYCDIARDSLIRASKMFNFYKLFLSSKKELKNIHKLVGEGNIVADHSYNGDDGDDLVFFAESRFKEIRSVYKKINKILNTIDMIKATSNDEIATKAFVADFDKVLKDYINNNKMYFLYNYFPDSMNSINEISYYVDYLYKHKLISDYMYRIFVLIKK